MANLIIFLVLLVLGYVFGQMAERRHFKSIIERERQYKHIMCFNERTLPPQTISPEVALVAGNVVISIDYFKRIVAGLNNIFGGRVAAYESLIERARREAILRMKAEAETLGGQSIFNVKLETASIYKGSGQQVGSVEVYAYGTTLIKRT
ncbi:MAG TPA: heavy metal-binding domain-containing protein [Crenotrichaceae bacterium]|nr:heavy metal-binding domain-containing protein [Crenotrichaceae bacterium]